MSSASSGSRIPFHSGDRLYGLNKPREVEQDKIESSHPKPHATSDVTIDRVNNRIGLAGPDLSPVPYTLPSRLPPESHGTDLAFHGFLQKHEDPKGKSFTGRDQNARVRRASKLGVDFTAASGGTVHFMLGGMEETMKDVVHKRNHTKQEGWKDVTGSELRHIYRNQDKLDGRVKFYDKSLKEVAAPWKSDPKLWSEYTPGKNKETHTWIGERHGSGGVSPVGGSPRGGFDFSAFESKMNAFSLGPPDSRSGSPVVSPFASPGTSPVVSPSTSPRGRAQSSPLHMSPLNLQPLSGSPVGSPRDRSPAPELSAPIPIPSRPAWNSSTRIDRPTADTATRNTKHASPGNVTAKVGSSHWTV